MKKISLEAKYPSSTRCLRVAHSFLGPGSDLAAIADRARAMRCDMVELDVLKHGGAIVVAHDAGELGHPGLLTLDTVLHALRDQLPPAVGLNVDLKAPGYERDVCHRLHFYELASRTIVSTMHADSLGRMRSLAPDIRLGWSIPKVQRDYLAHPLTRPVALAGLSYYHRVLPGRVMRQILRGHADAIMAHWRMVTPALAEAIAMVGGELYAWTVDDASQFGRLAQLGVTGIITNDVALFDAAAASADAGAARLSWLPPDRGSTARRDGEAEVS